MEAIRAFFGASDVGVSRPEFTRFADSLLDARKAILTFAWVPHVTKEDRQAFERAAVTDGVADYRITAIAPDDTSSRAPEADEYFPVYYRTELGSSPGYGINLLDGGVRQAAVERARETGQLAVTDNFMLHSEVGISDRNGFLALLPVYSADQGVSVAPQQRDLIGFVQGVFQFQMLIGAVMSDVEAPIDFSLFDAKSGDQEEPVYTTIPNSGVSLTLSALLATRPSWVGDLRIGDRSWRLGIAPSAQASHIIRHNRAWLVFMSGLLITGAVIAYMLDSMRQVRALLTHRRELFALARTDPSTGLPNRRAFLEELDAASSAFVDSGVPFAVYLIDLDGFKDVNDTLGHAVGDQLLKAVTARLARTVSDPDLVARLGGDEFAILRSGVSTPDEATGLAERIGLSIAAPYELNGVEVNVTASIGIAIQSDKAIEPSAVLMQADLALYDAKAVGRNCLRFHTSALDSQVNMRVTIDRDLRAGVDRGEFELHYQPQVEIASGAIIGLEALVRWNHPTQGQIPPSTFIPIAELAGGIVALGEWVLVRACRQIREWERDGLNVPPVSVNVSGAQLRRPEDFERIVRHAFSMWSIHRNAIELELTESVLMDVTQRQTDLLQRLQNIGATIAVDDFGTGYSSLRYVTAYPVNRLKIAQELIANITSEPRNAVVVRSAIRLAEDLGIECIAEGVETLEQARVLREFGCRYAQGYFYGRPMTAAKITKLLMPVHAPMAALPLR